ncbi:MAG: peptidoglycan-binding domain-containing protein, partial [Myxococcales bacterium]
MTRPLQVSTAASTRVSTVLVHRAPTAPAVLLKRGDEKPAVARLQEALQLVGHLKPPFEGRFDARTADAVTAFQQARGLPATGAYDAATRDALREAVAAAAVKTGPALSKGLRGEAVATLERKLKRKGLLEGPADGVFDGRTERAVKAFERQQGWKEDGVVGRRLWRTLGGAGAGSGPSLKAGASGPAVAALQRRLKQLGHYQGPADGSFGAVTERAVRAFQKQQGLTVDGRVDGADWAALGVHLTVREQLGGPLL